MSCRWCRYADCHHRTEWKVVKGGGDGLKSGPGIISHEDVKFPIIQICEIPNPVLGQKSRQQRRYRQQWSQICVRRLQTPRQQQRDFPFLRFSNRIPPEFTVTSHPLRHSAAPHVSSASPAKAALICILLLNISVLPP